MAAATLPDGKRTWLYGKTRADVQRKLTTAPRDVHQGLPVQIGRQTLGQFLTRWLEDSARPTVRPPTYESYTRLVRVHIAPALGALPLEQVTPRAVQSLLNRKTKEGLSPRTVVYIRAVLRRALGQALKWGLVARNAAALVDAPRQVRHQTIVLSAEQGQQLLDALRGDRLETLVTVTLALGPRRGEVLGVQWRDVDVDGGRRTADGAWPVSAHRWRLDAG